MRVSNVLGTLVLLLVLVALVGGCGSSNSGSPTPENPPQEGPPGNDSPGDVPPDDPPPGEASCADGTSYESTWEAIQKIVFERYDCGVDICHGSSAAGGLDLRPDVAYENLIEVPSSAYRFPRITPGDKDRSYLWLKLAAKTRPGTIQDVGTGMPSGDSAITEDELELVRRWIYGGAPETGTALETEELVDGCLPEVEPFTISPLAPPDPDEGAQLVMPGWLLEAGSEHEICFASYFDICDQVPEEFLIAGGQRIRLWSTEMRQDPQSHHLLLSRADPRTFDVHDPAFGEWTCKGGDQAGTTCEPTDLESCGAEGLCATDFKDGFACLNFGPAGTGFLSNEGLPGGSQAAQAFTELPEGVYSTMPCSGIIYWNSHAFNQTTKDHVMNARVNVYFAGAENRDIPARGIFDISRIFSPSAAPFTDEVLCHDFVLPENAHLYSLSSHTHQRGKYFTIRLPNGELVYESRIYNDPLTLRFDPALVFDSPEPAERTLEFCSLYNNGMNPDGSPNIEEVTRYSRLPQSVFQPGVPGRCRPIACVNEGMIGEPCNGVNDDRSCDSSEGANDGWCDACAITGGESTENEMFLPLGGYYVP